MAGFSEEHQALNEQEWPALADERWIPTGGVTHLSPVWYRAEVGLAKHEELQATVKIAFKKLGPCAGAKYIAIVGRTEFPDKGETLDLSLDVTKATFDEVVDAALTTAVGSLENRSDQIRGAQARYKDAADAEIPYSIWTYPALKTMAWTRDESVTDRLLLKTKLPDMAQDGLTAPVTLIFEGYKYMLGEFCVVVGSTGEGGPGEVLVLEVDPVTATLDEVVRVAKVEAKESLWRRLSPHVHEKTILDAMEENIPPELLNADALKQAEDYLSKPVFEHKVQVRKLKETSGKLGPLAWQLEYLEEPPYKYHPRFQLPKAPPGIKTLGSKIPEPEYSVWDRLQDDLSALPRQEVKAERELNKLSGPLSADVLDAVTQAFKGLDFSHPGQYTMEPLRGDDPNKNLRDLAKTFENLESFDPPKEAWLSADFGEPTEMTKITLPKGAFWLSFEDMKANDPLNLTRFFPTIFGLRKDISNVIWWFGLKRLSNQISPYQGPKG